MRFSPPQLFRAFLVWAVACVVTGWGLSLAHGLTLPGYLVGLPLVLLTLGWLLRSPAGAWPSSGRNLGKIFIRRFRRPLPLVFLVAAVLVLVGGAIYAPNNFDALTYRLPRMLTWLSHDGWTWIVTCNDRLNYSGTGWEWQALPLLLLHSDRGLFLINLGAFLLMPGLLFSIFRQLGIAGRVAWAWMWILPLAYGYTMQGGSVGNDMLGAVFCLMALHYGLRARHSGRVEDVWLAGLAAAFMTGLKTSNLPLLLPCLAAVWPALPQLRQRWGTGLVILMIGGVVSALPLAALNQRHTGSWTGDPDNRSQIQTTSPGAALLGNGLLLGQQLFMPPVLPAAHRVDAWFNAHLPGSWQSELAEKFPRYALSNLNELPQEEASGLGLGITLLLLVAVAAVVIRRGGRSSRRTVTWTTGLLGLAGWLAALVYALKMGSEATARLMLPYYPAMLLPFLILPGQSWLVRQRAWQWLAVLAAACILPGLILTPSRPLWPAGTVSAWLLHRSPDSALGQRLATVYASYQARNDLLAPLRARLPATATTIGFVAGSNDTDYSLWRPLGHRRVVYLRDASGQLIPIPPEVGWLVVKRAIWPEVSPLSLEDWAAQHHAELVASVPIVSLASTGAETWCLLRMDQP